MKRLKEIVYFNKGGIMKRQEKDILQLGAILDFLKKDGVSPSSVIKKYDSNKMIEKLNSIDKKSLHDNLIVIANELYNRINKTKK